MGPARPKEKAERKRPRYSYRFRTKMSLEKNSLSPRIPKPPTRKWVTFDDLIDDALESGKLLSPVKKAPTSTKTTTTFETAPRRSSISHFEFEKKLQKNPLDFTQSLGEEVKYKDKYSSAFADLRGRSRGRGWSGRVLTGSVGPFGWSDEVLESGGSVYSSDEDAKGDVSWRPRPTTLQDEDAKGDDVTWRPRPTTWEKSPSRSFVRNFP